MNVYTFFKKVKVRKYSTRGIMKNFNKQYQVIVTPVTHAHGITDKKNIIHEMTASNVILANVHR